MKIKYLSQLSLDEFKLYHDSLLYQQEVSSEYSINDTHLVYYKEYFGDSWRDVSLVVYEGNDFLISMYAFCFNDTISFMGGTPIKINVLKDTPYRIIIRAYQELFAKVDIIKKEFDVKKIIIYNDSYFLAKYFELIDLQKKAHVRYNSAIDLSFSEEEIRMNVRKSYKSLINWGYKNLEIKLFDKTNITEEIICQFEEFHIEVSKKRTRNHQTWLEQLNAVLLDMAFIYFGYLDNKLVSAVYIACSLSEAYYAVAVNNRDLMASNLPLGHSLLMESILESKRRGLIKFSLGEVTLFDDYKMDAISKYKRGFSNTIETEIFFEIGL